jgi:hypothetical protein
MTDEEAQYERMLNGLFSIPTGEFPPPLAPDDLFKVIANAHNIAITFPDVFAPPPPTMADYANALMAHVSEGEKIRRRKADRMAKVDIRSGWRAKTENPYRWWQ